MSGSYELAACPACASESARLVADREALKAELEELWQFHLRRRKEGIPARQLYDHTFFTLAAPLQLVQCLECDTLYRNPREAGDAVVEIYESEPADPGVLESLFQTQRRDYRRQAERLLRLAGRQVRGLELGSYVGAFLSAAREVGCEFEGRDINGGAVAFARSQGLRAEVGTLDSVAKSTTFDVIAIWNCFDQLPDPRGTLAQAGSLLRRGGLLAIRVPNGDCYAQWRNGRRPGLAARMVLAHNNLMGFPYRHGFTPGSLRALLQRADFEIVKFQPDVLVTTANEWTRPWAVLEERLVKSLLRRTGGNHAPWFELYAVKSN